jgi:energy-coupling factor transporter ATP-binding protein EcfA2
VSPEAAPAPAPPEVVGGVPPVSPEAAPATAAPELGQEAAVPPVAAPEVAPAEAAVPAEGSAAAPEPVQGDVAPLEVAGSVPPPVSAGARDELGGGGFVDARMVRDAAEAEGLRLPAGVYANVVAALATGRHLLLTGAPGSGKTTLALAVARAAAQAGRAQGATVVTAGPDAASVVAEAGRRGRWLVLDELDRIDVEATLGPLSTFLGGQPVTLAGKEVAPAADWRLAATWSGPLPQATVLRRFAVVEVGAPPPDALRDAMRAATHGDATAAAAVEELLARAAKAPIGAGVLLAAARHAAARNAVAPADADTLAREAYAAHVAPLLGDLPDAAQP